MFIITKIIAVGLSLLVLLWRRDNECPDSKGRKKGMGKLRRKKMHFSPVFLFLLVFFQDSFFSKKDSTFQTSKQFLINLECGVMNAFVLA